MLRRQFDYAACASLVLCITVVALWVRSYESVDQLFASPIGNFFFVVSSVDGSMMIRAGTGWPKEVDGFNAACYPRPQWPSRSRPGFHTYYRDPEFFSWGGRWFQYASGTFHHYLRPNGSV